MWNISIWAVIFQDVFWHFKIKSIHTKDTDFGVDGSYCWCHQRFVLFQNVHCYWHHIWIPREDWRNCFLKRYLISDYTIHAVIFFPVLMMMRLWDSHGERFYHKLPDKFLESWSLTWVKNGDRTRKPLEWLGLVISLTFEPTSWARIEICYWRSSLFEDATTIISMVKHFVWW